jgi:exodeoxyribonuclease-5
MEWAPQQHEALVQVQRWIDSGTEQKQIFRLFGYAGTGKTTLAIEIGNMVEGRCLFGSFTGKAALVMRKKGCRGAMTLHSLIYKPRRKDRGEERREDHDIPQWEINPDSALCEASLLIVDECSMVGEELARDVLSFNVPVLVLGDPAQLPPVSGAGYFTESKPDVMLTEIHRQAADNPIIRIATDIRTGKQLQFGTHKGLVAGHGVAIIRRDALKLSTQLNADQIICGRNDTRVTLNRRMREALRVEKKLPNTRGDLPEVGERIICLKNKRDRALLNGGTFTVNEILDRMPDTKRKGRGDVSYLHVEHEGEDRDNYVKVPHAFWHWNNKPMDLHLPENLHRPHWDEFDFAYAITCHKSQGSQWDKILVMDESAVFGREDETIPARWLYTALTRAAEAAIIVR